MYVCTCNGVSERQVDAAIKGGAHNPASVHKACGTKPQCGMCLPEIAARLRAARSKSEAFANTCQLLTELVEREEVAASA